jgi:hypothetical protein
MVIRNWVIQVPSHHRYAAPMHLYTSARLLGLMSLIPTGGGGLVRETISGFDMSNKTHSTPQFAVKNTPPWGKKIHLLGTRAEVSHVMNQGSVSEL